MGKKNKVKESRFFWADGTKKLYCIKNGCGPFRETDKNIHIFGEKQVSCICNKCRDFYYKEHKTGPSGYTAAGKGYATHKAHLPQNH